MDQHHRRVQKDHQCAAIQIYQAVATIQDF